MTDAAHYRRELSRVVSGRAWIVAVDVLFSAVHTATLLLELGATRVLAIGGSRGVGELNDDPRIERVDLGLHAKDMMDGIRVSEAALEDLPPEVQAKVEAFDPKREAKVIRALFSSGEPVGGRAVFGGRRASWVALEDKTIIDSFWDAAGVTRSPRQVVPLAGEALMRAHAQLDAGRGTVWVADNRDGWHGGAHFLRWVRSEEDAREARDFLGQCADSVRIMPFLDGLSCSIHGIVFEDSVIAVRPCEKLVFRVPGQSHLAYAAAATFWLPEPEQTEAMREVAFRVGKHLRETVDYRGAFTVDGIMTDEGFRPTELNPRYGAALARLAAGEPELPLYLLHLAMVEGCDLDYRPDELETLVLEASMRLPTGRGGRVLPKRVDEQRAAGLVRDERSGLRFREEGEVAAIDVRLGPATAGSYLILEVNAETVPFGPPIGPLMVEAFRLLDAAWDLGIGPLEAAG